LPYYPLSLEAKFINTSMIARKPKQIFVQGPIDPSFIAASIQKHSTQKGIGAHSIFLGQIRSDVVEGKTVGAIEYTAYEEMVLEGMSRIREALFEKYALTCLHVYHSLGRVAAGEICLFVFTSSAHRREAINACEELVERIKRELPIWGREVFTDDTFTWKKNTP
jgi:molybdopterin synthase catalytic subunit